MLLCILIFLIEDLHFYIEENNNDLFYKNPNILNKRINEYVFESKDFKPSLSDPAVDTIKPSRERLYSKFFLISGSSSITNIFTLIK